MKEIQEGQINSEQLIELFGTEKNKKSFKEDGKLAGNNKSSVLKRAQRLCDIKILGDGNYLIKNVYKIPTPPTFDKLNTGIYQYLAPIILNKLIYVHDKNNKITLPLMDYAKHIEMINSNYVPIKYNQEKSSISLGIDSIIMKDFFEKVDDNIQYYIQRCLEYLQSCDVLKWYKVPMIRKQKINIVIQNNKAIMECEYEDVRATSEEVKYVNNISEMLRLQMDIQHRSECFYGKKSYEFCKRMTELLKEKNIVYFYDSYEIYYTSMERCENLLSKFNNNKSEKLIIKKFNEKFIEHIVQNAEKRQLKEIEKELSRTYRKDGNYIVNFKTLSELTIPNEANKIKLNTQNKEIMDKIDSDFTLSVTKKFKKNEIEKKV